MKNKSNRYDINRPRSGHGHKYSKYKKYLIMMMLIYIPDFGVSTAILNPVDIFRRWFKLNFGLLRGHVKSPHITAILLKG